MPEYVGILASSAQQAPAVFAIESAIAHFQDDPPLQVGDPWNTIVVPFTADTDAIVVAAGTEGTDFGNALLVGNPMNVLGIAQAGTAPLRRIKFWYMTKALAGANWPIAGPAAVVIYPAAAIRGHAAVMSFKAANQGAPQFYVDSLDTTRLGCQVQSASVAGSALFIWALSNKDADLGTVIVAPTGIIDILQDRPGIVPNTTSCSSHVARKMPALANELISGDATGSTTWQCIAAAEVRPV